MDPRILQMIMALVAGRGQSAISNIGGGGQQGQWQNPGLGNIPSSPYQFPQYNSPYQSGFGSPGGDVMGNPPRIGQLPGRQLGSQPGMQSPPGQNAMLQQYLASQNPRLAMNPPQQMVDYRTGTMTKPRQPQMGGAPGNPFRVR